jgi:hypothetical protein
MRYLIAALLLLTATCRGQFASFNDLAYMAQGGFTETLTTNLLHVWSMDETAPVMLRTNSVTVGSPLYGWQSSGQMSNIAGIFQGANDFSETSIRYLTNANNLGLGTNSFTICVWEIDNNANLSWFGQATNPSVGNIDWIIDGDNGSGDPFLTLYDNGQAHNAVIVGSATQPTNAKYQMLLFGYDSTNNVIFQQCNGHARTTASCAAFTSPRQNMAPFTIGWLAGCVDECYIWGRALSQSEVTRLWNGGYGNKYPFAATVGSHVSTSAQIASNYLYSLSFFGKSIPDITTFSNIDVLAGKLIGQGIWPKLTEIGIFATNDIAHAILPIKYAIRADGNANTQMYGNPMGNNSFVDADVTADGVKGDGSTKSINTAISPSGGGAGPLERGPWPNDAAPTVTGAGVAIYVSALYNQPAPAFGVSGAGAIDWGYCQNGFTRELLYASGGGNTVGIEVDTIGNGITSVSPGAGYFSLQRTAANACTNYFANTTTPHEILGGNATTSGTLPAGDPLMLFAGFDACTFGQILYWSSNRISFYARTTGLTEAEDTLLFQDVTDYLNSKGGGVTTNIIGPNNAIVLSGNNATMSVFTSKPSPTYQWKKRGTTIVGATQSSYTVTGAALSDTGPYQVDVTSGGTVTHQCQFQVVTTTTVSNWLSNCYLNNSSTISSNTVWGVDQFWNGLVTDSLDSKYALINCNVPDDFIAARTPLLSTSYTPWVVHGTYTVGANGLDGSGGGYLDTLFNPNSAGVPAASFAIIDYLYTCQTGNGIDFVNYDGATQLTGIEDGVSGSLYGAGPSLASGSYIGPVAELGNGYYCLTRNSTTDLKYYFANSGSAHALKYTATSAATGTHPNNNLWVNGRNPDTGGGGLDISSFIGVASSGFSSTDSANNYNRIQTLRTVLGGGFR